MAEANQPRLVIIADEPRALAKLGGISLVERLRRIAINLGFREAILLSNSAAGITTELNAQTWRRDRLSIKVQGRQAASVTIGDLSAVDAANLLVVWADEYYDRRLISRLLEARGDCVLIDSNPLPEIAPLLGGGTRIGHIAGAARISREWLTGKTPSAEVRTELAADAIAGKLNTIDAAGEEPYLPSMRRDVRPCFFPAPSDADRPIAERLLMSNLQKGVLDFPAIVHGPIENWIVSHLCRTSVTPNQLTLVTSLIGFVVTFLYASGQLLVGVLIALLVGLLDGLDGKLARLKAQTTKIGKGEHVLDYLFEMSWWAALAFHFRSSGELPRAVLLWAVFYGFDTVDRLAKWSIERRFRRTLDDFSRFDRLLRLVGGRRNIYTWLFAAFVFAGRPAAGFVFLCGWGIGSAAIHIVRAIQARLSI